MAKKTENIGLRLPEAVVTRIRDLASQTDQSVTAVVNEFLPDEEVFEIISDRVFLSGGSIRQELRELIARGLLDKMRVSNVKLDAAQDFEIKVAAFSGSRYAFQKYKEWSVALRHRAGLLREEEDAHTHVFVDVEGGDGVAIVPYGWCARRSGGAVADGLDVFRPGDER